MLDHVVIAVSSHPASLEFYRQAVAPLGLEIAGEWDTSFAIGRSGQEPQLGFRATGIAVTPQHIALTARSRSEVDRFHAVALQAGGKDNGAPGLRAHYDDNYYAAFVIDPDGHNLEAVYRGPGEAQHP